MSELLELSTIDNLNSYSLSNPSKLLVIDFKASWCAPCKAIKPFIDYLKEKVKKSTLLVYL